MPAPGEPAPQPCASWFPADHTRRPSRTVAIGTEDDFVLRLYLREVRREPRLTPADEAAAGWLASFDDASGREKLVLGHLGLVVRIAFEYRGLGLTLGDLINEGNLGLMRATELFDPVRGVRFAHYAATWIRHRMRRALSYQSWPVRLPANFHWQRNRLNGASAKAELAGTDGPRFISLDLPGSADEENAPTLAELLPDDQSPAPDQSLMRQSDCDWARRLVATLKPAEQRVLRLRYGLDDGCERTLEEVGRVLGYVRQGIHKIESAALAKLRSRVRKMAV